MKKLLAVLLAVGLTLGAAPMTAFAFDEDEYDNLDFFEIKESNELLYPGQDYYFETDWQGTPIDDYFFEYYKVSVSVSSDDDDVSSSTVRRRVDKAEFVKNEETGEYYFHFRAGTSFSYTENLDVHILVLAKDKENTDKRSWYEFDLTVGYSDGEVTEVIRDSQYDVDNNYPAIEFDEDLKQCRLDFEDGSYFTLRLSTSRKFNFGYSNIPNQFVVQANPDANLYFINFYARPRFANADVLKLKVSQDMKYLYEINQDNTLTLKSDDNNNGYFGFTTNNLGAYVASDIPLVSPSTSEGISSNANQSSTPSYTAPGSVSALKSLVERSFSNRFVILKNGTEYGLLDRATTFSAAVSLDDMDTANLYLYTYDEVNNRLIQSPNRPTVGTDGKLYFTTNTKGYYVVSEGALTK